MLRYFWDLLPTLTGGSATSAVGAVAMPHWSCCELSREWGCCQLSVMLTARLYMK